GDLFDRRQQAGELVAEVPLKIRIAKALFERAPEESGVGSPESGFARIRAAASCSVRTPIPGFSMRIPNLESRIPLLCAYRWQFEHLVSFLIWYCATSFFPSSYWSAGGA